MKAFQWLTEKKVDVDTFYETNPADLVLNHHYISKDFSGLYMNLEGVSNDDLDSCLKRFGKDYEIILKLPSWVNVFDSKSNRYLDVIEYMRFLLGYAGTVRGVVLEIGTIYSEKKDVLYGLNDLFLKRVMTDFTRNGLDVYLSNGLVLDGHAGFSVPDMMYVKKGRPQVKLALNLFNSTASGGRIIQTFLKNFTLGGFGKNFDLIILSGIDDSGKEVMVGSEFDIYTLEVYKRFLKQFKKPLKVLRGDIFEVSELKKKL